MKSYDSAVKSRSRPTNRRYGGIVAVFLTILLSTVGWAQNLNNNGTIVNTGTMRIKGAVSGMPPAIDGVFEYFGANQNVPASTYKNLVLTGSGTKTTVGGNFTVQQNITIAAPVTLKIPAPDLITLGGTLTESGYLEGSIQRSIDLSGGTTTSAFGNIGATISWTGAAPGLTTVIRTSGKAYTGNGNESIRRAYEITSTNTAGLDASFTFAYHVSELNGRDENTLELWRSVDGGVTWRRQGGTVNTLLKTITKANVRAFSLWTASDAAHPLGPLDYEWVAKNLLMTAGNGGIGAINQTIAPFVVTVTDAYNNPISGVTVTFALASAPAGAAGQSLSATSVVTGADGKASTTLTLGNRVGTYTVTASAAGLVGSPVTFTATATSAGAAAIALISGNNQAAPIFTPLPQPFVVRVVDAGGNPVAGVAVSFSLASVPLNATGQGLSATVVTTDASGMAASTLTLGSKVGTYTVTASVAGLSGSPIVFTATATTGAPVSMVLTSGDNQVGVVSTRLTQPFVVQVLDAGGNPVSGMSVQFAIVSTPEGAIGQSLSNTAAVTDANGLASTTLTLGDKVGEYIVRASSNGLVVQMRATATQAPVGAPALITLTSGNNQIAPILTALPQPVVVTVTDASGRGVPGVPVEFSFTSLPTNATGQGFGATVVVTDERGRAQNTVTLGNKVGFYRFMATSANLTGSPVLFEARAVAGAPALLVAVSGSDQRGDPGAALPLPFVVRVLDVGSNPVPGATVHFAITSAPTGATGQRLSVQNAVTDASGEASTTLTLGDALGVYRVTASVDQIPSVVFAAEARVIVGDANNDREVNIADLTTVIDHILGRVTLVGADSIKADVNQDGAINILDVVLMRRYLLAEIASLNGDLGGPMSDAGSLTPNLRMSASVRGQFEATPFGIRFNLTNDVPVKGMQLILKYRSSVPTSQDSVAVLFSRASMMTIPIHAVGQEVRLVAYNLDNITIEPGSGPLFRLPNRYWNESNLESFELIVSTGQGISQAVRGPVEILQKPTVPLAFRLEQNYPNPFNPSTTIEFEVPDSPSGMLPVVIEVYDQVGAKVKTLASGLYEAGRHRVVWNGDGDDGRRVSSGVYYYRLVSQGYQSAKKMILLR
jgi:hypothetical protein